MQKFGQFSEVADFFTDASYLASGAPARANLWGAGSSIRRGRCRGAAAGEHRASPRGAGAAAGDGGGSRGVVSRQSEETAGEEKCGICFAHAFGRTCGH